MMTVWFYLNMVPSTEGAMIKLIIPSLVHTIQETGRGILGFLVSILGQERVARYLGHCFIGMKLIE